MSFTSDQMEPHPQAEDLNLMPTVGGHGTGFCRPPRRGVLVTVRCLKKLGVNLSPTERRGVAPVVGELKISRVHDRLAEFHSIAEIVRFNDELDAHLRYFPGRLLCLLNPEILWFDERGMVIYGVERIGGTNSPPAAYWQTWQVAFGKVEPGPPF